MSNVKVVSKDKEGNEKVVYVKRPSPKETTESKIHANILASRLLNTKDANGKPAVILRSQIDEHLRELGIWSDKDEEKIKELSRQISVNERILASGGIPKVEAKKIAIDIIKMRAEQSEILSKRGEMDRMSLEYSLEQANFDYLLSLCLLNEEGARIFNSVEEYQENFSEPYCYDSAVELSKILFGNNEDARKDLPEYKFLIKYGFMNEKYQWIDKDKNVIDLETGLRINENGRFINSDGKFIDRDGNLVTEAGEPLIENFVEFLD